MFEPMNAQQRYGKVSSLFTKYCSYCKKRRKMKIQNNDIVWESCICGKQLESKVSKITLQSMEKARDPYLGFLNEIEKDLDNADNLATGMHIAIDSGDTDLMDTFSEQIEGYVSDLGYADELPDNLKGHVVFDPKFSPHIKPSLNESKIASYVSSDSSYKFIYDTSKHYLILEKIRETDIMLYADVIKENITIEEACDYFPREKEGCIKCGEIPAYYQISHICDDPDEKYEEDFELFSDRMSWCCTKCHYHFWYDEISSPHLDIEYSSRVCTLCDYELNDNDEQLIRLKAFEKKHNDRLTTEEEIERIFIAKVLTNEEQDKFYFITSDHKNNLL